ncbi:hypothetical protein B0J17DRAFT_582284, partial [Rhizoctonia solani]
IDNASNNSTLVRQLGTMLPHFRGALDRTRCIAHIMNLITKVSYHKDVKAFMSLFDGPSTRARVTEGAFSAEAVAVAVAAEADGEVINDEPDVEDSTAGVDPDKLQHDVSVVHGVSEDACTQMKGWGVTASAYEFASGRQIAGLARRVNDSPALETLFRELVSKDPELEGNACSLLRHVVIRWSGYLLSISGHIYFKDPVKWLTGHDCLKLKKYALTDRQWELAHQPSQVLEIFRDPTEYFSQVIVPLIHEVLPQLLALRTRLYDIRDDVLNQNLSPLIRIGAESALLVFDKYIGSMGESDLYTFAVGELPDAVDNRKLFSNIRTYSVLCPDRKLKWFSDWNLNVDTIRVQILARFAELYPDVPVSQGSALPSQNVIDSFTRQHCTIYLL